MWCPAQWFLRGPDPTVGLLNVAVTALVLGVCTPVEGPFGRQCPLGGSAGGARVTVSHPGRISYYELVTYYDYWYYYSYYYLSYYHD